MKIRVDGMDFEFETLGDAVTFCIGFVKGIKNKSSPSKCTDEERKIKQRKYAHTWYLKHKKDRSR